MALLFVMMQFATSVAAVINGGSRGPDDSNDLMFEEESMVAKDLHRLRPKKDRPFLNNSSPSYNGAGPVKKTKKHHVACEMRLKDAMPPQPPALSSEELSLAAEVSCVDGFAGGYPCQNIDLLSILDIDTLNLGTEAMDLWGWVATDGSNREFALITTKGGTVFVEVTDPINPIIVGRLATHSGSSDWGDIKTYGNYAYKVSEASGHGMQIFDLTQLLMAAPGTTFSETGYYGSFGNAHNVFVNEDTGYAYAVGTNTCSGGLHIINLNNSPTNPDFVKCFSADGYTHDVQCVIYNGSDSAYVGREICFASNEDTVTIVDVTDKSNLVQISRTTYNGSRYTHQGWLTDDHNYFLFNDELDEYYTTKNTQTHVLDVVDLDNPAYVGAHLGTTRAIDHNLYIKNGLVFQANYRAGLQVLRITDIAAPSMVQVGQFDVFPSSDSNHFNGAWSNYPYLPSGNILISGIEQGLFVVRLNLCESNADCDDGLFCNGAETCDLASGTCVAGAPPCPENDGFECNGVEGCEEASGGTCTFVAAPQPCCGNGMCELGEDCTTCLTDCPSGDLSGAICGNTICEEGETCVNCPQDCNGRTKGRKRSRYCCYGGPSEPSGSLSRPVSCADSRCGGSNECNGSPLPTEGFCCGDGVCTAGFETSLTCDHPEDACA